MHYVLGCIQPSKCLQNTKDIWCFSNLNKNMNYTFSFSVIFFFAIHCQEASSKSCSLSNHANENICSVGTPLSFSFLSSILYFHSECFFCSFASFVYEKCVQVACSAPIFSFMIPLKFFLQLCLTLTAKCTQRQLMCFPIANLLWSDRWFVFRWQRRKRRKQDGKIKTWKTLSKQS